MLPDGRKVRFDIFPGAVTMETAENRNRRTAGMNEADRERMKTAMREAEKARAEA